jgi:hypothetical protein
VTEVNCVEKMDGKKGKKEGWGGETDILKHEIILGADH